MSETPAARPYTAPPVIEAVVQVAFSSSLEMSEFEKLVKRVSKLYEHNVRNESLAAQVNFAERSAEFQSTPQYRLSSDDEADVLSLTPEGLTWARLAPYEGWESFMERVKRDAAEAYRAIGFQKVARIGVRYINRIDVPKDMDGIVRYEDYLTINIDIPKKWPTIQNYAWRFERDFGMYFAIVQSAIVTPEIPGSGAFLLDIDVIARGNVPSRWEEIFKTLNEMRLVKNDIFETCISDEARGKYL